MHCKNLKLIAVLLMLAAFVAGCSVNVDKGEDKEHPKKVDIQTPFGGLKVRTGDVQANDTGLSVYPGATLAPTDRHDNENKANVNIDTPWFGLKVVALRYVTDDPVDKVWDYYKKEMAQYGRVLECKPGSPDMNLEKHDKNELTCHDRDDHHGRADFDHGDMQLKVGTDDRQRVVAVSTKNGKTEFALVYVNARDAHETM
jgi:hypothetical protein